MGYHEAHDNQHTLSHLQKKDVRLAVTLFPYLLKEYNRRWFLVAAAESDGKLLTFGLDRIDDVENLPSHNYVDYDGDLNELYEDIIGVTFREKHCGQ